MKSFIPFLLSLFFLGSALSQELISPVDEGHRGLCSPAISTQKASFAVGESIKPTVTICSPVAVEWLGIYQAGSFPPGANAANWQYTCGGQACKSPQETGTFIFEMSGPTAGALAWPLPEGSYQVFYMSGSGVVPGTTFTVGSAPAPLTSPPTPSPTPPPTPPPTPSPTPPPCNLKHPNIDGKPFSGTGKQFGKPFTEWDFTVRLGEGGDWRQFIGTSPESGEYLVGSFNNATYSNNFMEVEYEMGKECGSEGFRRKGKVVLSSTAQTTTFSEPSICQYKAIIPSSSCSP